MSRRSSPLDSEPCSQRQCTSFSDYAKLARRKARAEDGDSGKIMPEETKPRRTDCPLDKDELGNKSWGLLHTIAAKYPDNPSRSEQSEITEFFTSFSRLYPCDHCAEDLRKELKIEPPDVRSQEALSQWLCRLHNKVNVKIGKSVFDCAKIDERWRDGWLDGSCDY